MEKTQKLKNEHLAPIFHFFSKDEEYYRPTKLLTTPFKIYIASYFSTRAKTLRFHVV
jgi:hypothetical protein